MDLKEIVNKALGIKTEETKTEEPKKEEGGEEANQVSVEAIVKATAEATIAQLREAGHLKTSTTGTQQTENTSTTTVYDFSKIDVTTPDGAKAFDAYLAANSKELIKFDMAGD